MARPRNPNPTPYDLTIGERRGDKLLPKQSNDRSYHHIIPFPELRDFWNTSVACDPEPLGETLVAELIRNMGAYPLDQDHPERAGRLFASAGPLLKMIQMGNYVHKATANSPDGIGDFKAIYSWLPGNIFAGPSNRKDDPGEWFDSFASHLCDEGRYLDLLRAHRAIQAYLDQCQTCGYAANAAGTRARARVDQLAHTAGLALARVATYTDFIPYDPTQWPGGSGRPG